MIHELSNNKLVADSIEDLIDSKFELLKECFNSSKIKKVKLKNIEFVKNNKILKYKYGEKEFNNVCVQEQFIKEYLKKKEINKYNFFYLNGSSPIFLVSKEKFISIGAYIGGDNERIN